MLIFKLNRKLDEMSYFHKQELEGISSLLKVCFDYFFNLLKTIVYEPEIYNYQIYFGQVGRLITISFLTLTVCTLNFLNLINIDLSDHSGLS